MIDFDFFINISSSRTMMLLTPMLRIAPFNCMSSSAFQPCQGLLAHFPLVSSNAQLLSWKSWTNAKSMYVVRSFSRDCFNKSTACFLFLNVGVSLVTRNTSRLDKWLFSNALPISSSDDILKSLNFSSPE